MFPLIIESLRHLGGPNQVGFKRAHELLQTLAKVCYATAINVGYFAVPAFKSENHHWISQIRDPRVDAKLYDKTAAAVARAACIPFVRPHTYAYRLISSYLSEGRKKVWLLMTIILADPVSLPSLMCLAVQNPFADA